MPVQTETAKARSVPSIDDLIRGTTNLPVLPSVARQLIDRIGVDDVPPGELVEIIGADPGLAMLVLRAANAPSIGRPHEVGSVRQAISVLGDQPARRLVVARCARTMTLEFGFAEQMIWDHSVGVACAAGMIALETRAPEEAMFLCGLIHDIGKLVLYRQTPAEYARVLQEVYNQVVPAPRIEAEIYGYTHAEVGAALAERWQLPRSLTDLIARHHDLDTGFDIPGAVPTAIAIVSAADAMCRHHGIGLRTPCPEVDVGEIEATGFLDVSTATLYEILRALPQRLAETRAALAESD